MNRILLMILGYSLIVPVALPLPQVNAGTVFLMPPPPRKLTDADLNKDEDYPESHFGSAPSRKIASDSKAQFSARESDDWDYRAERAAAGLDSAEVDGGKSAVRSPANSLESDYVASGAAHTIYRSGSARKIASLTE
ncbi:MAG: hypothetical protein H7222_01095, partial [Methylotenera sp.]|nr:hypothetical protein [Oligoflexia bacterium]